METEASGPGTKTGDGTWTDGLEIEDLPPERDLSENNPLKYKRLGAVALFIIVLITSVTTTFLYLSIWLASDAIGQVTNSFSAFFGFMGGNIITSIGSFCGIVHLSTTEGEDKEHSKAILWLLITGIVFHIIFPTLALMPLNFDGSKRVPTVTLQECARTSDSIVCPDVESLTSTLYAMYIPILLEVASLIIYNFVWRRNYEKMRLGVSEKGSNHSLETSKSDAVAENDFSASFSDFY